MIRWHAVLQVWRRNLMVWRKLAVASLLGNVVDPVMALMAFGLGLGSMLPSIQGQPYLNYLAVGALCISAMNAPTFESLYSAFSRMHTQKTWHAIMNSPVRLREIVVGECLWAMSKGMISTAAMMLVVALLGIGSFGFWVSAWLVLALVCLMFAAFGLCMNARAPSYDFFMFYFTLVVTPMTFLSGAFFPRSQLPSWLERVADHLPLSLAVDALRGMYMGSWSHLPALLLPMMVYAGAALICAIWMTERRFKHKD
ncbi:ABC transporter permease [Limnobacter sp.]|uniref:ABC transporter permease n=1 Tax=Limnobacter sp. TaxID=2003368 RepID=UPI003514023B